MPALAAEQPPKACLYPQVVLPGFQHRTPARQRRLASTVPTLTPDRSSPAPVHGGHYDSRREHNHYSSASLSTSNLPLDHGRRPEADYAPSDGSSAGLSSPRFGSERAPATLVRSSEPDLDMVRKHLQAILEADRVLSQQLRREADSLAAKTQDTKDACSKLEVDIRRREQDEVRRLEEMHLTFDKQLTYAKQRLATLREERRRATDGRRLLHRDSEYIEGELSFLRQLLADEERMLVDLHRSNSLLEQSCEDLQHDSKQLEKQKGELLEELAAEAERLSHDLEAAGGAARLWHTAASPSVRGVHALTQGGAPAWASSLMAGSGGYTGFSTGQRLSGSSPSKELPGGGLLADIPAVRGPTVYHNPRAREGV
eukprot:TRINITY_DN18883_c0_g1_i2.p1 TRINITY_DN18883_c0_g1~~TRINITY_DN18883_c0_g1_i2.p1  ORF type:complete len:371 (-),score=85.88 TRINITY_DN18883_c0_g1_i2:49-1161(-)